jgi:hypothetical protein
VDQYASYMYVPQPESLSFNSLPVTYTFTNFATRQQLPTLKYAYTLSTMS